MNCENPVQTSNGIQQCRKCQQCQSRKRRHWLGRIAAEAFTSTSVRFVTLTYDEEHVEKGRSLPLDHLRAYNGNRRRKYPFRHFSVGEFGDKTNRPHWHSLQFYRACTPPEPLDFAGKYYGWAQGTSQYELPRSLAASASYVYDYLNKGGRAVRPSPGLGHDYLMRFAEMQARNRRSLAGPYGIPYTVPNARKPKGGLWQYTIPPSHRYAVAMANRFIEVWETLHTDPYPDHFFERIAHG